MQLNCYSSIERLKKSKFICGNLIKYLFNAITWSILNSACNSYFHVKLLSFLQKLLKKNSLKQEMSRLYLIKLRNEKFDFDISNKHNFFFKNKTYFNNVIVAFNHLQIVAWSKQFSLSCIKKNMFSAKRPFFVFLKICSYEKLIIFFRFYVQLRETEKKRNLRFESIILERNNIFFENNCSIFALKFLTSCRRKAYSVMILFFYIKLIVSKINYLNNMVMVKEKNFINIKIDSNFNYFLISTNNHLIVFFKIIVSNCKVMPSNKYCPIRLFLKNTKIFIPFETNVTRHVFFVKNKFTTVFLHTKEKKKFLFFKEKKFFLFKKNFFSLKNLLIIFKNNKKKNDFDRKINPNFFFKYILIKESKDCLNEIFANCFISQMNKIFQEQYVDLWITPFFFHWNFPMNGVSSFFLNSISLHELNRLKKTKYKLASFFFRQQLKFQKIEYTRSLTAYSLFCFLSQLKDRHNGNILVNLDDKVIHIDFGYILGYMPGNLKFEAKFFKLTKELLNNINGKKSEKFEYFKEIFIRGIFLIKKNTIDLNMILQIVWFENIFNFSKIYKTNEWQKEVKLQLHQKNFIKHYLNLIRESTENWKTIQYDKYQLYFSKIK
nr:phosphatidylinositol 4-kinase [Cryptomonas paramecium]